MKRRKMKNRNPIPRDSEINRYQLSSSSSPSACIKSQPLSRKSRAFMAHDCFYGRRQLHIEGSSHQILVVGVEGLKRGKRSLRLREDDKVCWVMGEGVAVRGKEKKRRDFAWWEKESRELCLQGDEKWWWRLGFARCEGESDGESGCWLSSVPLQGLF